MSPHCSPPLHWCSRSSSIWGAAYLIYLGIDLLRSKPATTDSATDSTTHATTNSSGFEGHASAWRYFRRGLLVDSLNPKIALFFLAFIPQFLSAVETPGFLVSVALGSVFLVTGAIVNGSIAYLAALGARRVSGRSSQWIRCRIPGGVLVFLGLRLLWEDA